MMFPKLPHNFVVGSTVDEEDCFFDSVAQCLQQLQPGHIFTVKSLRFQCKNYVQGHFNEPNSWLHEAFESISERESIETSIWEWYIENIEFVNLKSPISGRPDIEGRMLCDIHNVKLHVMEKVFLGKSEFSEIIENVQAVWENKVLDKSGLISVNDIDYIKTDTIHIVILSKDEVRPILRELKVTSPLNSSSDDDVNVATYKLVSAACSKTSEDEKLRKIQMLLSDGADINFQDANRNNNTILHIAIRKLELKLAAFLVGKNAQTHLKNNQNVSALDLAKQFQRKDIVDILKKKKVFAEPACDRNKLKQRLINEMVRMKTGFGDVSTRPKFKRGIGDSGFSGQSYEIGLLTLFLLRGEHVTTNFYLGCNVDNAGAFDDVVFKYWDRSGNCRLILLQAKHRDQAEVRGVNMSTFKTGGDLELYKYFTSFLDIKRNFNQRGEDPVFSAQFDHANSDFVIYTNACLDKELNHLIRSTEANKSIFKIAHSGKCIKLTLNDILPYLAEQELGKHIIAVAKAFVEFMFSENKENKMGDEFVRIYHVFWAKNLIKVLTLDDEKQSEVAAKLDPRKRFFKARFRYEFLDDSNDDPKEILFRNVVFHEYAKKTMIIKRGKKCDNPVEITETDWSELAVLLKKCNSKVINCEDIAKSSVLDTLCSMTGFIITYDAKSKCLNFARKGHLGNLAKKYMEQLEAMLKQCDITENDIYDYRLNILNQIASRKLLQEELQVPNTFGNVEPSLSNSAESLCQQFVENLEKCEMKLDSVFIIPSMSKSLMRDFSKLVGNVLELNDTNGFLKLADNALKGQTKLISEKLTCALTEKGYNPESHFDFQIEHFPRLKLCNFAHVEKEMEQFVNCLTIFTDQPSVKDLRTVVVEELVDSYKLTGEEAWNNYLKLDYKMTKWWEMTGKVQYLHKNDGFFSEIVRTGIHYRLKYPVESFTGRIRELSYLHEALQSAQHGQMLTVISQMTSISGLGGIGKSELARQYAKEYGHCYDNNIIWIEADNYLTMSNSFRNLARTVLNISTENANGFEKDIKLVLHQVYSFFSRRKCLFIFDNSERLHPEGRNEKDCVSYFLPKSYSVNDQRPCFIVTSRNQTWPTENLLLLDIFSNDEAESFVKTFLKITDTSQDDDIKSLTILLQNFPLALQQAVAYIREKDELYRISNRQFKIGDYVKFYEDKSREMLDFKFPEDSVDLYTKTTFITWEITIETIAKLKYGKEAKNILNMMAFLRPNDIPVNLFKVVAGSNKKFLGSAIGLLNQYSMVSFDSETANVHRLVQQVTRANLKDKGVEQDTLKHTLSMLDDEIERKDVTSHGVSAWDYASKYAELVKEFALIPSKIVKALHHAVRDEEAQSFGVRSLEQLNSVTDSECFVQHELVCVLTRLGKYDDALQHCKDCLEKRIRLLGPDNAETLLTRNALGRIWHKKGNYTDALECLKDVYEDSSKIWGANDDVTVIAQSNIANVLFSQCHYDESLKMYTEILEKQMSIFGVDHIRTLTTQNSIGNVLSAKGDYTLAMRLYETVLQKRSQLLGDNHPDTLGTKNDIGNALFNQCKYDEALQCFQQVFETQVKVLGCDHPVTLVTQNSIANVLQRQNKYDDALLYYREIYEKECIVSGCDHADTLGALENMASVLSLQGKHVDATKYLTDILEKNTSRFGPLHMYTLTTEFNLGRTMSNQGKFEEAERRYKEVYDKLCATYGSGNPIALTVQHSIGKVLHDQGKNEEALQNFQQVADKRTEILGPNDMETLDSQVSAADILTELGNLEYALHCRKAIFDKCVILHGRYHELTLSTMNEMAFLLSSLGKHDEALVYFADHFEKVSTINPNGPNTLISQFNLAADLQDQLKSDHALRNFMNVYVRRTEVLGPEDPDTLIALLNVGHELTKLKRFAEALSSFEEVFRKRTKIFGSSNVNTLVAQHNVGHVLCSLGKYEEALLYFQPALEIKMKLLGPDHPDTLNSQFFLAYAQYSCGEYNNSLKSFLKVYSKLRNTLGDNDPKTVSARDYIGHILQNHAEQTD